MQKVSLFSSLALGLLCSSAEANGVKRQLRSKKGNGVPSFQVKLTPGNAVAPFTGPDESGMATVSFPWEGDSPQACIEASVSSTPSLSHIHVAGDSGNPLGSNGAVVVSFTELIDGRKFSGCVDIDEDLYASILGEPGLYYADAHMGDPTLQKQIRGQLIQGYTTKCAVKDMLTVYPFDEAPSGTRGSGAVVIEAAGTMACFDFSIKGKSGWTPAFWHLHNGTPGKNGPLQLTFNEVADGFSAKGCVSIDPTLANAVLLDQGSYYFDFHGDGPTDVPTSDFFQVLRCPPLNAKNTISELKY